MLRRAGFSPYVPTECKDTDVETLMVRPHSPSCQTEDVKDIRRRAELQRTATSGMSADLAEDAAIANHGVDFQNISLYIPLVQVTTSVVVVLAAGVTVTKSTGNASQAFAAMLVVCTFLVRQPVRFAYARGADAVFEALRPSVFVWLLAMCFEQLSRSCIDCSIHSVDSIGSTSSTGSIHNIHSSSSSSSSSSSVAAGTTNHSVTSQRWHIMKIFFVNMAALAMVLAGFAQAMQPKSDVDVPFIVTTVCLCVMIVFAPGSVATQGPLCDAGDLFDSASRLASALAFVVTYAALVYAAPPERFTSHATFLCACRATGGSLWTLVLSVNALVLAPVQWTIVVLLALKGKPACLIRLTQKSNETKTEDDIDDESSVAAYTDFPNDFPDDHTAVGQERSEQEVQPLCKRDARCPACVQDSHTSKSGSCSAPSYFLPFKARVDGKNVTTLHNSLQQTANMQTHKNKVSAARLAELASHMTEIDIEK